MGDPLVPFITGVPEETLKIRKEPEEFSLSITKDITSGSGNGDVSGSSQGKVTEFSFNAVFNKLSIDLEEVLELLGTTASFSAILEVEVRGFVIFRFSELVQATSAVGVLQNKNETFDLINPIHVSKGDLVNFNVKIANKNPDINVIAILRSNILLKGIRQT